MRSRCDPLLLLVLIATLLGCDRDAARTLTDRTPAKDSPNPMQVADPELMSACDSVAQLLRTAELQALERTDGAFIGGARGLRRWGCRLAAADTLDPELPARPLDGVQQTLVSRGWQLDSDYFADSSDGSMFGLRRGTVLCVLQHFWESPSDDERATHPSTPYRYDAVVECFRDASR